MRKRSKIRRNMINVAGRVKEEAGVSRRQRKL